MPTQSRGRLWVVATPIGNLDDFSPRAQDVLKRVELIAAEDTRHSAPLLARFGIATRMMALHEHNERETADKLVSRMCDEGIEVALISDAGTPLVSDPGFRLVRAARAAGVTVSAVPGACAAIAALSIAGLPSDRFVFEGFLPSKAAARQARLTELAAENRTTVYYESSHRVRECLVDMASAFGPSRHAVLARELTKLFETVLDGTLEEVIARVVADPNQERGEFVLLIAGCPEQEDARLLEGRRLYALLREELPPARAAKLASAISGAPRKALYEA
ncbi:MAG: 16S rRNA (cytidine(1402)-2'-O)-methyltransferase [Tahibacter sp.]